MTAKQIIDMGIAYAGITKAELAQRLSWSPQLLQKRLSTGKLTVDEWKQIGDVPGATIRIGLVFPDGYEI